MYSGQDENPDYVTQFGFIRWHYGEELYCQCLLAKRFKLNRIYDLSLLETEIEPQKASMNEFMFFDFLW